MDCEQLKQSICNKEKIPSFLIFTYPDNDFLPKQYINAIADLGGFTIQYIDKLDRARYSSFDFNDNTLYVLFTEDFVIPNGLDAEDYFNVIVVSKKVTGKSDYVVNFPKLTEDNIKEYIETMCPGLIPEFVNELYKLTNGNIFRIDNEIKKIKLFPDSVQQYILQVMEDEGNFSDISNLNIFNLVDAILLKKVSVIKDVIKHLNAIDVEGTGLVTILINNIREILLVQTVKDPGPYNTGLNEKKLFVVKKKCGLFTTTRLVKTFKFLTEVDYKLKSGLLNLTNEQLVNYVIENVMEELYED